MSYGVSGLVDLFRSLGLLWILADGCPSGLLADPCRGQPSGDMRSEEQHFLTRWCCFYVSATWLVISSTVHDFLLVGKDCYNTHLPPVKTCHYITFDLRNPTQRLSVHSCLYLLAPDLESTDQHPFYKSGSRCPRSELVLTELAWI